MIRVTCPECIAKFKAPDEAAGRSGRCPKCGAGILIRSASPPPAPSSTASSTAITAVPDRVEIASNPGVRRRIAKWAAVAALLFAVGLGARGLNESRLRRNFDSGMKELGRIQAEFAAAMDIHSASMMTAARAGNAEGAGGGELGGHVDGLIHEAQSLARQLGEIRAAMRNPPTRPVLEIASAKQAVAMYEASMKVSRESVDRLKDFDAKMDEITADSIAGATAESDLEMAMFEADQQVSQFEMQVKLTIARMRLTCLERIYGPSP